MSFINSRLTYVSVSRGRDDAQIYTNDVEKLGEQLSRGVSKQSALETGHDRFQGGPGFVPGFPGYCTENATSTASSKKKATTRPSKRRVDLIC
jgi:hypothetical protein